MSDLKGIEILVHYSIPLKEKKIFLDLKKSEKSIKSK